VREVTVATYEQDPLAVLRLAEQGEEVVILRGDQPVAKCVPAPHPIQPAQTKPRTPDEIRRYLERRPMPAGPKSPDDGTELVGYGRGEV
jgi:antitoxin (DNA-binding transcriptional repressor) of toxin-antitoxin stability system